MFKTINKKAIAQLNSGFGTNSSSYGGRFINKDGTANVKRTGLSYFSRISWYHTLLDMSGWKFLLILLFFYISINFAFALLYFTIGLEHLNGINASGSVIEQFGQAYFFSAQTFTTVGYGHISPRGFMASAVSAVEALIGLLSFAIATGLFFGRFSRPIAYLKFSHNALIAPYGKGSALMIRLAPYKNTNFTEAEAKITLGMSVEEEGKLTNKFYSLDLEFAKVNSLSLSWTLVHPITEESPLCNLKKEDFAAISGEIFVFIKTFDDMFSTIVASSSSYTFDEIVYGAKFIPMFSRNADNSKTILDLDKLNEFENSAFLEK